MENFEERLIALNDKAYEAFITTDNLTAAICFNATSGALFTRGVFVQAWISIFSDTACVNHIVDDQLFEGKNFDVVFKKIDEYLDVQLEKIKLSHTAHGSEVSFEDHGFGD